MSSQNTLAQWADLGPIDSDFEKTISSLLQSTASNNNSNNNTMADEWRRSIDHNSSESTSTTCQFSPYGVSGLSPGSFLFQQPGQIEPKGASLWTSNFKGTHIESDSLNLFSGPGTSFGAPNVRTPVDQSHANGGKPYDHVRNFAPFEDSVSFDDFMTFEGQNKASPTPQLSPDSLSSHPSPINTGNGTLSGYHNNVAANHAQCLTDLVNKSSSVGASHSDSRTLPSSLSRSVINLTSEVSSTNVGLQKGLSIQQRRRLSLFEPRSPTKPSASEAFANRRCQKSSPDTATAMFTTSPDFSKSLPAKQKRPSLASSNAGTCSTDDNHFSSEGTHEDWNDPVLANSHDLVFVLSLKGTVLYMSPSVKRILGYLPEEVVGRPLVDFSHPADIGPFSRELKESITLPNGDEEDPSNCGPASVKPKRRVDLIMRMSCKSGGFSLIETTGRVSVDPPKHRKVVVCSGRPRPIPMLPWNDVREDLLTSELSAWLKVSHNGIFLGSTGPINKILGIEDVNLLGRHIRDLPMVASSSDLLEALRCGRSISVQDHYVGTEQKAPVKLTVYPWTSDGRSHSLAFVHVQQQPTTALVKRVPSTSTLSPSNKRKMFADDEPGLVPNGHSGSGSLSGAAFQLNGSSLPVMTANDAAASVFSELTAFHSGSWLIEMQKLHSANRRLRHELSVLRKRSPINTSIAAC